MYDISKRELVDILLPGNESGPTLSDGFLRRLYMITNIRFVDAHESAEENEAVSRVSRRVTSVRFLSANERVLLLAMVQARLSRERVFLACAADDTDSVVRSSDCRTLENLETALLNDDVRIREA